MLTDREWLRFVTFALFAGAGLGASYSQALALAGRSPVGSIVGALVGLGGLALLLHLVLRYVLDRASEPPADDSPTEDTT